MIALFHSSTPDTSTPLTWLVYLICAVVMFYIMTVGTFREYDLPPRSLPSRLGSLSLTTFIKLLSDSFSIAFGVAPLTAPRSQHGAFIPKFAPFLKDQKPLVYIKLDWDGLYESVEGVHRIADSAKNLASRGHEVCVQVFSSGDLPNISIETNMEGIDDLVSRIAQALGPHVHYWVTLDVDPCVVDPADAQKVLMLHALSYHAIKRAVAGAQVGICIHSVFCGVSRWWNLLDVASRNAVEVYCGKGYRVALDAGDLYFPGCFGVAEVSETRYILAKSLDFLVGYHRVCILGIKSGMEVAIKDHRKFFESASPATAASLSIVLKQDLEYCTKLKIPLFWILDRAQCENVDNELGHIVLACESRHSAKQEVSLKRLIFAEDPNAPPA
eukprot:ANDGO_04848.mRNA.1 hypothetical protein